MNLRLKTKILGVVALSIVILVSLIVWVNQKSVTVSIRNDVRDRLHAAREAYEAMINDRRSRMSDMNHMLSLAAKVKAGMDDRRPLTALQSLGELVDRKEDMAFYMVQFAPMTEGQGAPPETGGILLQDRGKKPRALVNPHITAPAKDSLIPGTDPDPIITDQPGAERALNDFPHWQVELMTPESLETPLLKFVERRNNELAIEYEKVSERIKAKAKRESEEAEKISRGEKVDRKQQTLEERERERKELEYPASTQTFISTYDDKLYLFAYQPVHMGDEALKQYRGLVMGGLLIRHDLADIIRDATSMKQSLNVSFAAISKDGQIGIKDYSRSGAASSAQFLERSELYAKAIQDGRLVVGGNEIDQVFGPVTYLVQAVPMSRNVEEAEKNAGIDRGISILEGNISHILDPLVSEITTGPLYVSLVVAVAALLFLWDRFRTWVTNPVHLLHAGMGRIQSGDLDTPIDLETGDEMGELAGSFNQMLGDLKKKQMYMRMVSEKAVEEIEKTGKADLAGDGERRVVTVLFSDIRDFTTLCERIDPNKLIQLLNKHFDVMVGVIRRNNGRIDKFIGDAIMAVFEKGDHARNAVLAALEMQAESKRLDVEEKLGLKIGVGLHTGDTIYGYVGHSEMFFGTYLGDTVNVAARLEAQSKHGKFSKIIISKQTLEAVGSLVDVTTLAETHVKGKTEAVHMFEIVKILEDREILEGLLSADPEQRCRSAVVAGNLMDGTVSGTLVRMAADPDEAVALAALQGIARLVARDTGQDMLPSVLELIQAETRVRVRSALAILLGTTGDHRATGALESLLVDADARVRANAVESVEKIGGRALVTLVRPRLEDVNNRVKTNAAILLFESDPDGVTTRLLADLSSETSMMRASSAFAISQVAHRHPTLLPGQVRDRLQQHEYRMAQNFQLMIRELTRVSTTEKEAIPLKWIRKALQALLGYETARSILDQTAHETLEAEEKQLLEG